MTDLELIRHLSSLGVKLWVEDDALRFRAPRGALTEPLKEQLRARREALREMLQAGSRGADLATIPQAPRDGGAALSFAQERLWFLHQLDPADPSYTIPLAVRFEGELDEGALARALREVVRRHEVLRTAYTTRGDGPVAIVGEPFALELPLTSLVALPEPEREAEARREMAAEARRPFDLAAGLALRARLLQLGVRDHVLFVAMHHIASDGWSVGVLSRELAALYGAFSQGRPSPLAELPIQYADHAAWQRGRLEGPRLDEQIAYWKARLAAAPRAIELPTDRPRPAAPSHQGARRSFAVAAEASSALEELCRPEGATLFMTLLAAFDVLLYRWSGQPDVVVGTPIAGRTRAETEGLIGLFVNTLVLRAELTEEMTFRELLARVREECLGAYAHQDTPFERLVQALEPQRDVSRSPLFQVMFALQHAPPGGAEGAVPSGLRRRGMEVESGTAKFDLTLAMSEGPRGLSGAMEYTTDLFDADTIDRMLSGFQVLLTSLVAQPDARLSDLSVLPDGERRRLVVEWNGTALTHVEGACIHELLEAQAARTPEAVAISFEGQELRYRELDERGNQLAHALKSLGVGPEVLVAVCLDRSLELCVALHGVLKAGGAYVPIDPEYPAPRVAFMLDDARPRVILTQARLADALPSNGAAVLRLDTEWASIAAGPTTRPARDGLTVESLAYVIYTSGSTGRPKGVMVTHHNVVRLFDATARGCSFGPSDVWTLFHSYAFDFSVWEIWGALLHGGRVVVVPYWVSRSPDAFHALLRDEGVTVLSQTPSAFRQLVRAEEALDAAAISALRLRYVIFGGEALAPGDLRPWWARHGDVSPRLVNMYGITETTVHVTARPVGLADLARPWSSVIGRPIADLQVYVLDPRGEPVPVGVAGELYVGGAGVSRGYLARPELTAERFLPDPFRPVAGQRLYRTGDLARHLASGDLEYLGRLDHQVKLRGFRIELGEIEAALRAHPAVREVVALAREDTPGDQRLVAYVVTDGAATASELRAHVAERLPEHMVPSAVVLLPALPLGQSGKLDRRALPAPGAIAGDERAHVEPRGPVEEGIAAIFAEVLKITAGGVGAHDGFFELGGHSLLATSAVAHIRDAFGVELPLRALFEAQSPAELATRVTMALAAGASRVAPPMVRVPRDGALALSFAQERLWFLDQIEPGDPSYVVPMAMRLDGALDARALERALHEIVRRHEVLRTTYATADGVPVAVIDAEARLSLPVLSLRGLPEAEREAAARREMADEARHPFDLAAGPVIRARLIALGDEDHLLLLSLHHIAADGWSLGVLGRELSALYEAFSRGKPSPLGELSLQYADYAAWQRGWLAGEVLDRQVAYWRERLAGAPRVLDLPTDRPRPPVPSHRGAQRAFALPAEAGGALGRLAREQGATLYMVLLAAFDVLLYRWSGQPDVVVGTPIAGRTRAEAERLVGLFVNTLVLRAQLDDELTFRELLTRVREGCLGAYAHQDTPFERLVQELEPERDVSRSPLFQVMFALQNVPAERTAPSSLRGRGAAVHGGTAKFDLTLAMSEGPRGLSGAMEYATDLFDAETIDRMLSGFQTLLASLITQPDARVCDLSVMPDAERRRLLEAWSGTTTESPRDATIHALFEAQAARTPEAVALTFGGAALSYGALDRRANQLARRLVAAGVTPGAAVGLHARRSIEMVVATLAILKAGGAYVPLDPELPAARLAWLVADAGLALIVAAGPVPDARALGGAALLHLDAEGFEAESDLPLLPLGSGDSLAYVMYTSGSTGAPKGVCVVHRGVVRLVKGTGYARFGADEVFLQLAPIAFDAATLELWGPLLNGGKLVVYPAEPPSPARLGEIIREGGITTLWLTAGLFNVVIDADAAALAPLHQLLVGGEALSVPHVQKALRELPGVQLINGYGPTEGTTFTCCHLIASADAASIPIGRPIASTRVYILDRHLEPAPIGVPGELFIGGDRLARGYLNRPELDAERFVPDPFGVASGARLYRTGDLVRWLPDGTIAFLGRRDDQVKLRGFRIELGEIEAVLGAHPEIAAVAVVVREDAPGDRRLVAYVASASPPSPAELRAYLAQRLPGYMVPSAFVALDALPLTPSGKVDRGALPAPEPAAGSGRVAPRGPVEEALAAMFAEVLRLSPSQVGAHDGFFELGGHSLLATQVAARARAALGVELPLRAVFEAPTVAGLAARVDALLRGGLGLAAPPLVRIPRDGALQLSFAQERLWFLDQLEPGDPSYVVPMAMRLEGALDAGALERALVEIVRRHEVLRTTYATAGGVPVAVIDPEAKLSLPVTSLRGLPDAEREAAARREMAEEARRPFDLAAGPVIRARLIELGDDEHVLLISLHHIVSDAWSLGVLGRELTALYEASSRGEPSPLAELSIQVVDHAAWQRGWLSGEVLDRQLGYWKERLAGAPRALDLPTDRPRPRVQSHRGAQRWFSLPAETGEALARLAREQGATLYMALLAALDVLLHRWSGQPDVVVGTPIAGRTRAETEGLIGLFVNTLVLRAQLDDELTFRELLARVREGCLGAYAHQDTPFERLVQELEPERGLGRSPLFQVMFTLQHAPVEGPFEAAPSNRRLRRRGVAAHGGTAKFDLTLALGHGPRGLSGVMEYATDLFDADTIDRMLAGLRTLVASLVAQPDARLSDLSVLPDGERRRVLAGWNDTAFAHPEDAFIHELFEAQATRTPEAVAISFEGQELRYRELDERKNQLAHALKRLGVGPEVLVAVCLDRSLELVVALLGVLEAGGAYLPIDPEYPAPRVAFMLDDARPRVILTQAHLAGALPSSGATVLRLDTGWASIAAGPTTRPTRDGLALESLAYVIYTSGSTGRPKGAMNTHRGALNRLLWMQHAYGLTPTDRVLQKTPFSFDVSVWELFWPLMFGARLVVARPGGHREPGYLLDVIERERISALHFVPSMLQVFLEELERRGPGARPPALRQVICSGEALPPALAARFFAILPGVALDNLYGPTEAAVDVTAWTVEPGAKVVPIGRPVHNTRVYVLDPLLEPAPIGVRGELYLGGVQVGRGYLDRPELTAERFVPDPFGARPGARLYRTGDVARWLPNGAVEYLGRADFQVKLRGFRVELGEIESTLLAHPAVREAVVLAREDTPGDPRLVAYLVARDVRPSAAELRAFLLARLPEHMVPSAFVVLAALPLISSGKLDRRALPAPEAGIGDRTHVAPRGPVEEALAAMFAEVLRLSPSQVGAHDGFFELGGHSLLATQVTARVRATFGVELPLRAIFEAPSPAELALRVMSALEAGPGEAAPSVARVPRDGALLLSFGQERLWVLEQLEPGDPAYVVPSMIRCQGPLDARALERALGEIVRRHEVLRTTYATADGRPVQVIHERLDVAVPIEDLRARSPREREEIVRRELAAEALRAFDLEAGPMLRGRLLALADEEHLLLLSMHHIVCDAWSQGVLRRELGTLYEAFHQGRPSPLAELPIQYADYAAWQRRWFSGDVEAEQLAYWRGQLAGASQLLELPCDRPRPAVPSRRGAARRFSLPAELAGALRELGRREGATLFMTLLAAFDVLLHRVTGQDDLSVGAPIANRGRAETEGLIGFFLNTLVLRARVSGESTFRALLAQVKETCLGAYAHQDAPFERLVQALDPERDLGRSPLFQVMFTLLGARGGPEPPKPSGLRLESGFVESAAAKFDLSLGLGEAAGGTLSGVVEYATDLFDAATIERLVEHLGVLLDGVTRRPDQPLGELPLLSARERRTVLAAWNDTAFAHGEGALLHELFAAQAARTPEAVALSLEGQTVTYRELDERVNRLAHALRRRGVGPEVLVGVCMERSIELCVALLGVLTAGGAYVPIDPEYPAPRVAFMLDDARPRVILAPAHLADALPSHGAAVLRPDTEWASIAAEPTTRPPRDGLTLDDLAYVIYTSGSTGRPKGAMNAHRGILNRLSWMTRTHGLGAADRVLQKTPFSFDISVWELFWPLISGARLVVARPGGHREPGYLVELIEAEGVTAVHFVPSMLALFLDALEAPGRRCRSLRRVICSGEALPPALAARFFAILPGVELHNLYGPTEAAVEVTAWTVVPGAAVVPIGRPIHNTRVYVLDPLLEPAPIGVRGELYLGGVQVGRGYLNRPELTAERFVPDPFGAHPGARLYRTGDVARWLPSGAVEYLGRADFQVKLRGFRVELGEIEAALRAHPSVRAAAVVAREDGAGAIGLAAYLVLVEGAAPTVGELRGALRETLPEHMLPAAFVLLPALPLTASGKLDRRALPAPEEGERPARGSELVVPRTAAEVVLARIWASVLRLENVGVHDNFFEMGGDSILSIQIVARAAQAGLLLTPRQLFQTPTIAALAAAAGGDRGIDAEQGAVTGALIATPIQRWWLEQGFEDRHHWNQSVFLEVPGRLEPAILEEALGRVIEHHDALRLRLSGSGELSLAPPGVAVPLLVVDLEGVPEAELRPTVEQAAADAQASLALDAGPVLRGVLFDRGPGAPSRLLVVVHHLAVDAVSWRILLDDLWAGYAALARGELVGLPAKTTSFQRWAERLAAHARSEGVEGEATFWLEAARRGVAGLPLDHERGENTEESARHVVVSLGEEETEALLRRVPEVYRTQINDVLLTAFAQTLGGWTGAGVTAIDLEGHGREEVFEDVDLTRTVGWFTCLFPVVLELDAEAGPGQALRSVKEQLRAIPGRGLGYGLLRYLGARAEVAERLAAAAPAEVLFNYLGQRDEPTGGGGAQEAAPRPARESSGPSHSPRARRAHLLELNASVSGGRLVAQWTYSERRHRRGTIEALALAFADALRALIAHCLAPGAGGATPSDFQSANLTQDAIDMLAGLDPEAIR